MGSKPKSIVWKYFCEVDDGLVTCTFCDKSLKAACGRLKTHILSVKCKATADIKELVKRERKRSDTHDSRHRNARNGSDKMSERENVTKEDVARLTVKCREAMLTAHCPYSKFPVGAALLCDDGSIYLGCNVENAAYSLGICAERTAAVKAVSEGKTKFRAIAVSTKITTDFASPCGACRQFLAEFGLDIAVYLVKPDLSWKKTSIRELLPMAFSPESLNTI